MATIHGTYEFGTGDLEGLSIYLRQRARGLKSHKHDTLMAHAHTAENAADRICELQRKVNFYEKQNLVQPEQESK